jgi:cell division protein FtsQ
VDKQVSRGGRPAVREDRKGNLKDKPINRYRFGNHPALEERRGRAKLARLLLFTVIFFTLLSATFYGLSSSLFNLQELNFQGQEALTPEELAQAFPYPLGLNIWKVDVKRVAEKYASLPRIHRVEVERKLPRALVIRLEEKKTAALIPYQAYYYEVAFDGTLVALGSFVPPGGFPMLTELSGLTYRLGENINAAPGGPLVIAFLEAMGEETGSISEINIANPNNLIVFTLGGRQVWMGRGGYGDKLQLLPSILAALPQRKGYLDFRVLEAPSFVAQ